MNKIFRGWLWVVLFLWLLGFTVVCVFATDRPARYEKPEEVVAWLYRFKCQGPGHCQGAE